MGLFLRAPTSRSFNMVFTASLATLLSLSTLFLVASAATVQKPFLMLQKDADQNRQAVRDMFQYSYDAYKSVLPCGAAVGENLILSISENTRGVTMT